VKTAFTEDEDRLLISLQQHWGNQWIKISTCMKGRSNLAVINRWNILNRKNYITPRSSPTNVNDTTVVMETMERSLTPLPTAHIRESCNFSRQNERFESWPFVPPGVNWSPVKITVPGAMRIHHFSSCGVRTTIQPTERERILKISSISFPLLLVILREEFGWQVKHGHGLDHTNDIFISPTITINNQIQPSTFSGNSVQLRSFVNTFGFTGQNIACMETTIRYILFVDSFDQWNTHTGLVLSETPSKFIQPLNISFGHFSCAHKQTTLRKECENGYVCDCCVDWYLSNAMI
jgi:hypothetical protein